MNEKLWAREGLGHSVNVLGEALKGRFSFDSSKICLFFPELCSFRRVFCFPRFCKIWRQTFEPWGFWFQRCHGALLLKTAPVTRRFLTNSDYDHEYFLKTSILFSKQSRYYLPDSYGDPQAEQSSLWWWFVETHRMET